jgi:acetyl esterase/lipase
MGDSAGGGLSASLMLYQKDFLRDETGAPRFGLPGGAVLLSPWVDLTCSQPSWVSNAHVDYLPSGGSNDIFEPMYAEDGPNPVAGYLWGQKPDPDRRYRRTEGDTEDPYEIVEMGPGWKVERRILDQVSHPLISPLFGNLRGLPPVLIQAGDSEMLRDETLLFAKRYSEANRHRRGSFAPGMDHPDPVIHGSGHGHVRHELFKDQVHVFQAFLFLQAAKIALQNIGRFHRNLYGTTSEFDEDAAVLSVKEMQQEGDIMVTVADVDNEDEMEMAKEMGDGEMELARETIGKVVEENEGRAEGGIRDWLPSIWGHPVEFEGV